MLFISDFADLGLVLPVAGLVGLTLALLGRRREALAWCLAVAGTLGTMAALKLLVFVMAGPLGGDGLGNPSGHTASGVVLYAGLLVLLADRVAPRVPVALLAGVALALLFGLARVALRVHTLADVLVGGAVGIAGALALARALARPAQPRRAAAAGAPVLAAVALAAVLTFHGNRLIAEAKLRAIAAQIQSAGDRAFD
ncbi:phosphatase PAP2 family protein [Dankookia sp. GCM10030260]|uniref:phosphatase PAP2 family protein n=1 Tax=Dankookia sp. GCM10030260 TaxID=3273390 RepID=UPI00360EC07F